MAVKKQSRGIGVGKYKERKRVRRPGVIAKTKQSRNKNSKDYVKPYVGQGR